MRLCRYNKDMEEYIPISYFWEYIPNPKHKIIYLLDKDTKHAIICKIIHRHKKPKSPTNKIDDLLKTAGNYFAEIKNDYILESIGASWNCVRCKKECKLNLIVDIDSIKKWKGYCKMGQYEKRRDKSND